MDPQTTNNLDPETAKALLDKGLISKDTHDMITNKDSAGQPYTVGAPSKDIREILPNVPKEAPILASSINPIGILGDIASKATDVGISQNQQQTQSTAEQATPGPGSAPALGNVQQIPGTVAGAQQAVQQIAPAEEKLLSEAARVQQEAASNIQKQQEALQVEFKKNLDNAQIALDNKAKILQQAQAKIALDPQKAVQDNLLDHPVLSSIAFALSGIGSGLSGQNNMAMEVYQKSLDRAINKRAQDIQALYQNAQASGEIAESTLSRSQVSALSQQISAATTLKAAESAVAGIASKLQSVTAKQRAQILINDLQQKAQPILDNIANIYKGTAAYGDKRNVNALDKLLNLGLSKTENAPRILNQQLTGNEPAAQQPVNIPNQEVPAQPKKESPSFFDKVMDFIPSSPLN